MSSPKNRGPKGRNGGGPRGPFVLNEPQLETETTETIFKASRETSRVAIIGRPNVGKSTLFNYLTSTRKAVVKDQPGVTRDIQIEPAEIWGVKFDVIDTGGLTESTDMFSRLIREQVLGFLKSTDHLIVVLDGRAGLCPEDRDIIRVAKESGKPFLTVINKVDHLHDEELVKAEFYELGVDLITTSFEQVYGLDVVLEWIVDQVKRTSHTIRDGITLAMVGKPNVGKSSLCNRLLGEKRLLVSPVAGTTIDAVDTELIYEDRKYVLIDTAGLRRNPNQEDLEIISTFKTRDAIGRADIIMLVIDGNEGPTSQDAKILQQILEKHRAVMLVVNKVDTAEAAIPAFRSKLKTQVEEVFHFFPEIPMTFVSALTGRGLKDMFDLVVDVETKITKRIKTRELNDFFLQVIRQAPAPVWGNDNVKFYYLTQTNQQPPAFIAFANHPDGVTNAYRRFLVKRIQEHWDLQGIPIRIFVMTGAHRQKKRGRKAEVPTLEQHLIETGEADVGDFEPATFEPGSDIDSIPEGFEPEGFEDLPPEAGFVFGLDEAGGEAAHHANE
jgi:GTP-binding protein